MTQVEILTKQTQEAYNWTNKLLEPIPFSHWDTLPETIETSVSWQVGHLIMSLYFHSILVIKGHQMDIIQKMPLPEYNLLFTEAPPLNAVGKANPLVLKEHFFLVQQKSIAIIESLSEEDLSSDLVPTSTPHPIAKTKWEALDWNIKHTMYHCGQIGILKRIVHERHDFGLRIVKK